MAIFKFGDAVPEIHESAYIAPGATVIGRVRIAAGASIWPGAVLRGDNDWIVIGRDSNVQEGAILHTDPGSVLTLGTEVTVGHQAMLHGCTVGDGSLVGIQAVVLERAKIGAGCLVGACSLVTEDKVFEDGSMILGSPARVARALTEQQIAGLRRAARSYADRGALFRRELVQIG
ncbi:MAG: gamma carbonic anhydrase family protein [Janthinobacterium lividum]